VSTLIDRRSLHTDSLYLEVNYARAVVTKKWKYIAVRFPEEIQRQITPENRKEFNLAGERQVDYYRGHLEFPGYYHDDQLYDLENDPEERLNVIKLPENQEVLETLRAFLKGYSHKIPHRFGEFSPSEFN